MHAENARVDKKAVLAALTDVQQQQMTLRTNLIKAYFPALLNNAPLVGKYDDLASFENGIGKARADEILAQTDDAMALTEKWLAQLNAYYKKEFDDAMAERGEILTAFHRNLRWEKHHYPAILPGKQIIFLWEEGGHAVPEIMDTALEIIKEVKKTNPGKRILLAPEQLLWYDVQPFKQSALLNNTAYNQPAVHFADGENNPKIRSTNNYDHLWGQISNLGVDIMAMDDVLIDTSWLYSFFKVGDISIPYAGGTPEAHDEAYTRFRHNQYAVHYRNAQWERYIRAVAPYYDVIIVYAGSAHYGLKNLLRMPADKVLDVFMYKLVVADNVKQWEEKVHKESGDYASESESLKEYKRREASAKRLKSTAYSQLQANGLTSALYILIP